MSVASCLLYPISSLSPRILQSHPPRSFSIPSRHESSSNGSAGWRRSKIASIVASCLQPSGYREGVGMVGSECLGVAAVGAFEEFECLFGLPEHGEGARQVVRRCEGVGMVGSEYLGVAAI